MVPAILLPDRLIYGSLVVVPKCLGPFDYDVSNMVTRPFCCFVLFCNLR